MELPKNITQIGEADKHCRIYVEDYVVSYIKQMNGMAQNKDIAIALYGRKTAEDGVAYLFAYGSAKLNFLQKPVRHLSQAQEQEIEKLRRKYFSEMTFLGYQILNGEMVEGFQICEQEICRYVSGYAQFYEKNDSMLAYMLENRGEEAAPEKVDQEKYEVVKKRQEERRQRQESGNAFRAAGHTENAPVEYRRAVENRRREPDNIIPMPTTGLRRMKMAAAGVFVLLCVMALALMRQESTGESLGGDSQAGHEQPDGAETAGCGGGTEPDQHAGGGGQVGGCSATGKCCGGKYYWGCSRDSDAGRHGKCINGWNGKQCCRSDGRKYGQCSGWNLCGQQCHKKYDRCDGGNRTEHDTGNNTGCDTDGRTCSGRDSYSGGGCSTHTLYYPERGHTDRYFSAELRQQQ